MSSSMNAMTMATVAGAARAMDEDDRRWQAVSARDRRLDGAFVYAVKTTGVYCRPSCPSRRPRRENVVFFAGRDAARQAGFRACLRCRPDGPAADALDRRLVELVCRAIEKERPGRLTLDELGREVGRSPYHLQRTFKRLMGITPRQYAEAHRLGTLKTQLRKGEAVTEALYSAGFGSSSRLYETAGRRLGMTPAVYRKGGHGARIGYTVGDSPVGRLLVAATERGVCAIKLGDADGPLVDQLRGEYPNAQLTRDDRRLEPWVRALVRLAEGRPAASAVPLDIQATAFQSRVYAELQRIPPGETRTYGEVARAIGRPAAVRAVARACATNPVAVAIPCHRVIGKDGGLTGYRWGVERKQALLEGEKA